MAVQARPPIGATLSPCGTYRYRLWRSAGPGKTITWIGLNPSTADATTDDPTLRRCLRFSREWGFATVELVNLFAFRATDPKALLTATDPIGPRNHAHIQQAVADADQVVACWGFRGALLDRALAVLPTLPESAACLGHTRGGHPRHPLYVAASTPLIPLRRPNTTAG